MRTKAIVECTFCLHELDPSKVRIMHTQKDYTGIAYTECHNCGAQCNLHLSVADIVRCLREGALIVLTEPFTKQSVQAAIYQLDRVTDIAGLCRREVGSNVL